jgi:hypothetical protein
MKHHTVYEVNGVPLFLCLADLGMQKGLAVPYVPEIACPECLKREKDDGTWPEGTKPGVRGGVALKRW